MRADDVYAIGLIPDEDGILCDEEGNEYRDEQGKVWNIDEVRP